MLRRTCSNRNSAALKNPDMRQALTGIGHFFSSHKMTPISVVSLAQCRHVHSLCVASTDQYVRPSCQVILEGDASEASKVPLQPWNQRLQKTIPTGHGMFTHISYRALFRINLQGRHM